jgi:hypothetical protein
MKLYEKLNKQKLKGIPLNFKDITEDTLKTLFVDEEHSNEEIASLYGIKKLQVTLKRKKFGLTEWDRAEKHVTKDYHEWLHEKSARNQK